MARLLRECSAGVSSKWFSIMTEELPEITDADRRNGWTEAAFNEYHRQRRLAPFREDGPLDYHGRGRNPRPKHRAGKLLRWQMGGWPKVK